ncbi:MAG: hypothetical protein OXG82_10665 [Gammaproteobacteria bacterium]|nr:hypothetical protein [Gammaproteobacteria bacterium]
MAGSDSSGKRGLGPNNVMVMGKWPIAPVHYYYVPLVAISGPRVVYWGKFGRPGEDPPFRTGFPDAWWWDESKAQRIRDGVAGEGG